MSHEATTLVKGRAFGSTARKAIALVLADYCDAALSCFVGQARLAFEAEVGERTVRRILADMEAEGLIRRQRRADGEGHRLSDRIVLVQEAIESLPAKVAAGESLPAIDDRLPATRARLPATDDRPTGQALAGEPSVEPSVRTVSKNQRDRFEEFWEAYPVKRGKPSAKRAWDKAIKHTDPDVIIAGVHRYRADPTRDPTATKYPQGWLNDERWNDQPIEPSTPKPRGFAALQRVATRGAG